MEALLADWVIPSDVITSGMRSDLLQTFQISKGSFQHLRICRSWVVHKLITLLNIDAATFNIMTAQEVFNKVFRLMPYTATGFDLFFLCQIVDLLYAYNIDVNVIIFMTSPLHLAAQENCVEMFDALIKLSPNIDLNIPEIGTPLHIAVENRSKDVICALLKHGADINSIDNNYGVTPLHLACDPDDLTIFWFLLEKGVDVNTIDHEGNTPLHYLINQCGYQGPTERLLKLGADINKQNLDLETPFECCIKRLVRDDASTFNQCGSMRAIVRHLVLSKHKNKFIHSSNLNLLGHHSVRETVETCERELCKMKEKIKDTTVSMWNVLVNEQRKVDGYVRNSKILMAFHPLTIEQHFPVYKDMLLIKFYKATRRMCLIAQIKGTAFRFARAKLNKDCLLELFTHLTNKDLEKFANSLRNKENQKKILASFPKWATSERHRKRITHYPYIIRPSEGEWS